eukprot:scaffold36937_cov92-Phaeocystis_antarctica.AAC.1
MVSTTAVDDGSDGGDGGGEGEGGGGEGDGGGGEGDGGGGEGDSGSSMAIPGGNKGGGGEGSVGGIVGGGGDGGGEETTHEPSSSVPRLSKLLASDALVVGGYIGVYREVLGRKIGASLYACDATDTHGRSRVEVERIGIKAAVHMVHAAGVVGIGVSDVARRDAVGAARFSGNATLEHGGGRVEVDRSSDGTPVDGEDAAAVIGVRNRQIVGRPGVGAARNGIDTLRAARGAGPVVDRSRVPAVVRAAELPAAAGSARAAA